MAQLKQHFKGASCYTITEHTLPYHVRKYNLLYNAVGFRIIKLN